MKLNKSTTVLLNVVLILVVAILVKNLFSIPKPLYGGNAVQYRTVEFDDIYANPSAMLNEAAKQGWRFVGWTGGGGRYTGYLIFEK
jgi:hypothetical protein